MRSIAILFFSSIILFGCEKDLSPTERALKDLSGTWDITTAEIEKIMDPSVLLRRPDYEQGSLGFLQRGDGGIYFISNGLPVEDYPLWPVSGTIKPGEKENELIIVETQQTFTYSYDGSQLKIKMWDTQPYFTYYIPPHWTLTLTRQ